MMIFLDECFANQSITGNSQYEFCLALLRPGSGGRQTTASTITWDVFSAREILLMLRCSGRAWSHPWPWRVMVAKDYVPHRASPHQTDRSAEIYPKAIQNVSSSPAAESFHHGQLANESAHSTAPPPRTSCLHAYHCEPGCFRLSRQTQTCVNPDLSM